MAHTENYKNIFRVERFTRLLAAYDAAARWELPRTQMMLYSRLLSLGAYIDNNGSWRIDEPPAAGSSQPY